MSIYINVASYVICLFISYKIRVLIANYLRKTNAKSIDANDERKTDQQINIALFFSGQTTEDQSQRQRSFERILSLLESARHSLDICMYSISLPQIIDTCVKLHRNKVRVRLITNGEMRGLNHFYDKTESLVCKRQIMKLIKAGIDVTFISLNERKMSAYMHNKFAIIDRHILINGSLNWTKSALLYNYDDVIVTTEPKLVSIYLNKFNDYWTEWSENELNTQFRH